LVALMFFYTLSLFNVTLEGTGAHIIHRHM
jgi:hypothetical protein